MKSYENFSTGIKNLSYKITCICLLVRSEDNNLVSKNSKACRPYFLLLRLLATEFLTENALRGD